MNPEELERLRRLFMPGLQAAPRDATATPRPPQPMTMRAADEEVGLPDVPEPSVAQRAVQVAQEFVPGFGEGMAARRMVNEARYGRMGNAAAEGAMLAAGVLPVGDAARVLYRNKPGEMRRLMPRPVPVEHEDNFRKWFGKSILRNEEDVPIPVTHGTTAATKFDEFMLPDRIYQESLKKSGQKGFSKATSEQLGIHVAEDPRQSVHFATNVGVGGDDERFFAQVAKGPNPQETQDFYIKRMLAEHGRTMPLYARVENPLRMPDAGNWTAKNIYEILEQTDPEAAARIFSKSDVNKLDEITDSGMRNRLQRAGYDAIAYKNTVEGLPRELEKLKYTPEYAQSIPRERMFSEAWPDIGDAYVVLDPRQLKSALYNTGAYNRRLADITRSLFLATGGAGAARAMSQPDTEEPENP